MEYQKITSLIGTTVDEVPRFTTKKWVEVHDQSCNSEDRYKPRKQIKFKTSMLRSDLYDFSDGYIIVKGTITVTSPDDNAYDKSLAFKNNAPFVSCVSKINNTVIENAGDLDVVMSMHNYYRDEPKSAVGGANNNINYSINDSKSFDYKTIITGKLEGNNTEQEVEIVVPLKNLNNFWRTLDMPLINCEISLILARSENCVLTSKATRDADPDADPVVVAIDLPKNTIFKITDIKLYVLVVTLSTENDKRLLEQLRAGFKRTIK